MMKTITSRDLDRDIAAALRDAQSDPVFIEAEGKLTHVLMSIEAGLPQRFRSGTNLRAASWDRQSRILYS